MTEEQAQIVAKSKGGDAGKHHLANYALCR